MYYHLSNYGHDLLKPTLFGIGIIALSTFLWFTQTHSNHDFSLSENAFFQVGNFTGDHLYDSFRRSLLDFIPPLPAGSGMHLGVIDYAFKIVGAAVTFGLIIIALRRKFERKYTR